MKGIVKLLIGGIVVNEIYNSFTKETSRQKINRRIPKRRIFISHSWEKGTYDYNLFMKKLRNDKVDVYNHSIPMNNSFDENRRKELENIFRNQMVYCSKVFVLASKGLKANSYVRTEMRIARELNKEIIAVKPYGQKGVPDFVRRNSDRIINNRVDSIKKVLEYH